MCFIIYECISPVGTSCVSCLRWCAVCLSKFWSPATTNWYPSRRSWVSSDTWRNWSVPFCLLSCLSALMYVLSICSPDCLHSGLYALLSVCSPVCPVSRQSRLLCSWCWRGWWWWRCLYWKDVLRMEMCLLTGCDEDGDVSVDRMCWGWRCVCWQDVMRMEMCLLTGCVADGDVSVDRMCWGWRCVW